MKNIAFLAILALSATAFGQRPGKVVEMRPSKPSEVRSTSEISSARNLIKRPVDAERFDRAKEILGERSMTRIARLFAENVNMNEASDVEVLDGVLRGMASAVRDLAKVSDPAKRDRVTIALESALIATMKTLKDSNGSLVNGSQPQDVFAEIGTLAKTGQINEAVKMAEQVTKLQLVVAARASRGGESLPQATAAVSFQHAVNQFFEQNSPMAINPAAIKNANNDWVIMENGRQRPFDPRKDIMGKEEARRSLMEKFQEVLRCMGMVAKAA